MLLANWSPRFIINCPIDTAMEANIRALFKTSSQQALSLEGTTNPNTYALHDVLSYIGANSVQHTKTSMKSIMDRFYQSALWLCRR